MSTITEPTEQEALEALATLAAFLKCNGGNRLDKELEVDGEKREISVRCTPVGPKIAPPNDGAIADWHSRWQ